MVLAKSAASLEVEIVSLLLGKSVGKCLKMFAFESMRRNRANMSVRIVAV